MKLRNIIATCGLLAVTLVGGLSAAFTYNGLEVADILIENIPIEFGENDFIFDEVDDGGAFKEYINDVIEDINKDLNGGNSVLLENLNGRLNSWIGDFTYFGSMAVTGGEDAYNNVFDNPELTEKISIVLEAVDANGNPTDEVRPDNYYILYLTNVDLGEKGTIERYFLSHRNKYPGKPVAPVDGDNYGHNYVYPVYKTALKKNDNNEFTYQDISIGAAQSCWYQESNINGNITQIPCFDTGTWKERTEEGTIKDTDIKPGSSKEHAIWVYAPKIVDNPDDGRTEANTITVHPEVYVGNNNSCYYKNFISRHNTDNETDFTYTFSLVGPGSVEIYYGYDSTTPKFTLSNTEGSTDPSTRSLDVRSTNAMYFKFTGNDSLTFSISR